jgi:hypothetical protein
LRAFAKLNRDAGSAEIKHRSAGPVPPVPK